MSTRIAIRIAIGLGAALLAPVLIVVALGLYGESQNAAALPKAGGHARLTVSPDRANLGDTLLIVGEGWPPRQPVRIELRRPDTETGKAPPIRIGGAISSRSGTFAAEVVLPSTIPIKPGGRLEIAAVSAVEGGPPVAASAGFEVIGFGNRLVVAAVDVVTRAPVSEATVDVRDHFGVLVATHTTAAEGTVTFWGLTPGPGYTVGVRSPDRRVHRILAVEMPAEGTKTLEAELVPSAGERFYLAAEIGPDADSVNLIGVDLAAELAVKERVRIEPWARRDEQLAGLFPRRTNMIDAKMTLAGFYPPAGSALPPASGELALAVAALQVAEPKAISGISFEPFSSSYLGINPATGELIVSVITATDISILHIDPQNGRIKRIYPHSGEFLGPLLAPGGRRAVLFDWSRSVVVELDFVSGAASRNPAPDARSPMAFSLGGDGTVYVFSEPGGRLYRVNPGGEVRLVATLPDLSNNLAAMAPDPSGTRILLASADDNLVFSVDTASGQAAALFPVPGKVEQIIFAGDGERVFLAIPKEWLVAVYSWPGLQLLNSIPLAAESRPL